MTEAPCILPLLCDQALSSLSRLAIDNSHEAVNFPYGVGMTAKTNKTDAGAGHNISCSLPGLFVVFKHVDWWKGESNLRVEPIKAGSNTWCPWSWSGHLPNELYIQQPCVCAVQTSLFSLWTSLCQSQAELFVWWVRAHKDDTGKKFCSSTGTAV